MTTDTASSALTVLPLGNSLIPPSAITSQWSFDFQVPANSHGVMTVFIHPLGAPLLFNCTFDDCESPVVCECLVLCFWLHSADTSASVKCHKSSCHCTSWCGLICKLVIFWELTIQCTMSSVEWLERSNLYAVLRHHIAPSNVHLIDLFISSVH